MFAPDIEEDANSHFQRIYTSELQIEGVIQMLKGFKSSASQREQEVFACMIHNLFDEYRFFPRYPERELLITGKLFGSLIQHQLVSSITLGIALRYVLEALRKPLRSNMFKFGMCALEQFKQRLVEWPQYCHHILQIAHIRQAHEDLIDYIQRALNARPPTAQEGGAPQLAGGVAGVGGKALPAAPNMQNPQSPSPPMNNKAYGAFASSSPDMPTAFSGFSQEGNQLPSGMQNFASDGGENIAIMEGESQEEAATVDMSAAVQQTLSVVSGASAFGATTNVDMLLQRAKQVKVPDSVTQDKVFFVFNNLSNANIDTKEKDLSAALNETDLPWFTQYLVIKRAAQEQNYHQLYIQLADRLEKRWRHLLKNMVLITIENIKILLVDDKIRTSSSLRSLLKNLGSWLGALTLGKNKPILQKDLDFKALILEAFDKGRLIAIIPFIAKIMESCANSRIFRPPNPWTMMVLGILAELHPMADLKLTIKFEVEVLCKNLNKELKDVKVTTVFKGREAIKEASMDWSVRNPEP
ncbi:hypothetical protein T484DRAFT_1850339 [Baffinella frigidus]|nr:hypothetical protein T484DRAFT_1850339 [Cryptophyta sp. CCMP2293]